MLNNEIRNNYSNRRRRNIVLNDSRDLMEDIDKGIKWENSKLIDDDYEVDLEEGEEVEEYEYYEIDLEADVEEYEELEIDDEEIELEKDEIEKVEAELENANDSMYETDLENMKIGNKKVNLSKFKEKDDQVEVEKITIYLGKNLVTIMKMLKNGKRIQSYSQFITDAIKNYLTE